MSTEAIEKSLHNLHYQLIQSPAVFEDLQDIITEAVSVLIQQSVGVVEDLSSVVSDTKLGIAHFWFDVERVCLVSVV